MYMGSGHDPYNVDVGDRGELIVSAVDLSPSGTTTVEKARRELEVADDLGEDLADYPLGFGIYENFAFMGGTVGFAVFAMRAPDDSRLFQDFVYPILNVGKAIGITPMRALQSNEIEAEIVFSKFGATLAKMHRRGYVHTTPHLNNVGLIGVGDFEVVMRDLSAAKKLAEMTPEQRVGYLMLDLGRVMRSLYRRRNFNGENYSLSLSVQPFMLGYMGDQLGINPEDFRQLMEPFSVVDRSLTGERVMGFNVYRWAMANRAFGIRELLEYIQYMICK
jgi:hypothetical protein